MTDSTVDEPGFWCSPDGFSTPQEAVDFLLSRVGTLAVPIIDTGCGVGAILKVLQGRDEYASLEPGQHVLAGVEKGQEAAARASAAADDHTHVWCGDSFKQGPWASVPWGTVLLAPPTNNVVMHWQRALTLARPGGSVFAMVPVVRIPLLDPKPTFVELLPKPILYNRDKPPRYFAWVGGVVPDYKWRTK